MMEFVSWDDEIPNIWKIKNVPNHQTATISIPVLHAYIYIHDSGKHPYLQLADTMAMKWYEPFQPCRK